MTQQLLALYLDLRNLFALHGGSEADTQQMVLLWISVALSGVMLASYAVIFGRARLKPWPVLFPGWGDLTLLRAAARPWWWVFILVGTALLQIVSIGASVAVPFGLVGFVVQAIVCLFLVQRFGKGTGYYLGVLFLPFIFLPMLALGAAEYKLPYSRQRTRARRA